MGRHGRPDAIQKARSRTFRAAATAGVLGTLAFGYHSATTDTTQYAKYDAKTRFTVDPDADSGQGYLAADLNGNDADGSGTGKAPDQAPDGTGPTASSSAPPKLLRETDGGNHGAGGAENNRSGARGYHGQGHGQGPQGVPFTGRHANPADQADLPSGSPSRSAGPSVPSTSPGSSAPQQDSTDSGTEQAPSSDGGKSGPVAGTVKTVGGVVDSLVGGLGSLTGGLLGR